MAPRPDVPYSPVQSVMPDVQQPNDAIRAEAQPQDFGSGIGSAFQQAGQAAQGIGGDATNVAAAWQQRHNLVATDEAFNEYQEAVNKLQFGDPNDPSDHGYFGTKGADALNARGDVLQKMEAVRLNLSNGMQNGNQQLAFDEASRRLNTQVMAQIGQHSDQQWTAYATGQQSAQQDISLKTMGAAPADEATFQTNLEMGLKASAAKAVLLGQSDEAINAAQIDFRNKAYATRAEAMGATDPVGALNFVTNNQNRFDGQSYATLIERIKPKANAVTAQGIVNGIAPLPGAAGLGPAAPAVSTAAQNLGVDPVEAQTVAHLESHGGALADTPGNSHTGVFQMGPAEFAQNNPGGTRGNATDEAQAGVANLKRIQPLADAAVGGTADPWQVYLMHQQGDAGGAALLKADPSQNAVAALAPAYKGDRQAASAAIVRNGGDPNGTVGQFTSIWQQKYATAEQQVKGAAAGQQPFPDLPSMEQKVLDQTAGDPELQRETLSTLHQRMNLINVQAEQAKTELSHTLSGTNAALLSGDSTVTIPEMTIRAAYPAPEADRIVANLQTSKQAGQLIKGVQFATPDQLRQTAADLDNPDGRLGTFLRTTNAVNQAAPGQIGAGATPGANALPPETPDQTLRRQQIQKVFTEALTARNTALNKDPASYVAAEPNVKAAAAGVTDDPATFEAYARTTQAAQKALGVQDGDTRVLVSAQSQALAKQLISGDPAKTDAGAEIDSMAKKYGDAWPSVWHDLVRDGHMPPEWQVLGAMPAGADRMQLQRALQVVAKKEGVENMRRDIDPMDAQSIDRDIDGSLSQFRKTVMIPGLAGNADLFSTVRSAVRASAIYGSMTGLPSGDALHKAASGALPYDYSSAGFARAPKGQGDQADSYGASILSSLSPDAIGTVKTSSPDMLPGQTQLAYTAAVKRSGVWVTNERDDGWTLAVPDRMGGYQLVTRPDGSRIGFKFSDMAKGDPAPVPSLAPQFPPPGTPAPSSRPPAPPSLPMAQQETGPLGTPPSGAPSDYRRGF